MTSVLASAALGSQTPRVQSVPRWATTAAAEAAEICELVGLTLDPWQLYVLEGALGRRRTGRWSALEVAIVVCRQNGKGAILEARELLGLFVIGETIVHSAHRMDTAKKAHDRLWRMIKGTPELVAEVEAHHENNNELSVELRSGARIEWVTRSQGGSRGWTEDLVILDEAFALTADQLGAILPVVAARPHWQVIYTSSAGKFDSSALREVRKRGTAGEPLLAYYEWSVDPEAYRLEPETVAADPRSWAQANPAKGIRIEPETFEVLHRSMPADEFAREFLGVWDDARGVPVIDSAVLNALIDPDSMISGPMVMALDASPGQASGAIGVAGRRPDGVAHFELTGRDGVLDHRPGTDWMVSRAVELDHQWGPVAWVLDPAGPAGALLADLRDAGIDPHLVTGREMAQACGSLLRMVTAPERDRLRHLGQQPVLDAAGAAKKRDIGDGAWAWGRKASDQDISPLVVMTEALHSLAVHGTPEPEPAPPQSAPAEADTALTSDLRDAGF